jgi:uncharacterized protein YdeI (YjbR/CyaY-like superfamily)
MSEVRTVDVPDDLGASLRAAAVDHRFTALSVSHRREDVEWVTAAERPKTRANRVAKAVARVGEDKTL